MQNSLTGFFRGKANFVKAAKEGNSHMMQWGHEKATGTEGKRSRYTNLFVKYLTALMVKQPGEAAYTHHM